MDEGDVKIVNCLRNTLTSTSNIVLLCCVNPGQQYYEHSLPAMKFCARIRDCIIKKLGKEPTASRKALGESQSVMMSMDDIKFGT
jgi:hypothetical protein